MSIKIKKSTTDWFKKTQKTLEALEALEKENKDKFDKWLGEKTYQLRIESENENEIAFEA